MSTNLPKIYLDAGHGGYDPGAVGYVTESKVNIKVVNFMYSYLTSNYECSVYKDITANDSLRTICNRANKWGADLFISIHFNAGKGDGFEALVYGPNNKDLGELFCKYAKSVGQNLRGVKYRPELGVLRMTDMQAVLCEVAFVDNWKDIKDWKSDTQLKKMAEALARAAAERLNLKKKTVKQVSTPQKTTFIKSVQTALGMKATGTATTTLLEKTVTVSATTNTKHKVVKPIQVYLNYLGYNCGTADGVAGPKFDAAVKKYQKAKGCVVDGEITAKGKTWKKLLGLA